MAIEPAINLRDFFGQILDAIEQALFHVPDCEHHRINVVARGRLDFIADLGHEIVGHLPEIDGGIHPLFHTVQKLWRAHEVLPRLREGLKYPAANLFEDIWRRRIVSEGEGRLHDFRHRIHPHFLEGRRLLRSFFKVVAHRFNPQ